MYELKKLLLDIGIELSDSWKKKETGYCCFCGRYRDLSTSSVIEVLKRGSNPAYINFHTASIPAICHECSVVYENITKKNLSSFFDGKRVLVVDIDTQEYNYVGKAEDLKGLRNVSVWYSFMSSKYMPLNSYIREITVDTEKGLWVNAINGTKLYPIFVDLEDLKEYEGRDIFLHSLKKYLIGGEKDGKSKSGNKKKAR